MGRLKTVLEIASLAIGSLLLFFLFLMPFPKGVEGMAEEKFYCVWEDGEESEESDFEDIRILGAEEESIFIEQGSRRGKVKAGEEFLRAVHTLDGGDEFEIISFYLKEEECTRLEKLALFDLFGDTCVYLGEKLLFDGRAFVPTEREEFSCVRYLKGSLPENFLKDCKAKSLIVGANAQFSAKDLLGSEITSIEMPAPYFVEKGAVYLKTISGVRLVAVLPGVEKLELSCEFIDEGALCPCENLKELVLRREYNMTLAMMFEDTPIPEGLKVYEEIF